MRGLQYLARNRFNVPVLSFPLSLLVKIARESALVPNAFTVLSLI